jgi:hypothetical protein
VQIPYILHSECGTAKLTLFSIDLCGRCNPNLLASKALTDGKIILETEQTEQTEQTDEAEK